MRRIMAQSQKNPQEKSKPFTIAEGQRCPSIAPLLLAKSSRCEYGSNDDP
jgi:hypothetical protein